jgi:poly-gamma-glutamate synthesis protein (capsule biosynthesis protein)
VSLGAQRDAPPPAPPATVNAVATRNLPAHVADGFTLATVGDCIVARPVRAAEGSPLDSLGRLLREADVAFGNFEGSAFDLTTFRGAPQAEFGGQWLLGSPAVVASLKAFGFEMMSRANNHTTDWGVEGMRATDRLLDEAGIVHAGTGASLSAARAPRYFESPKGRVALVAMASSFTPLSRAMDAVGEAPARPGVDALRTHRSVLVTAGMMKTLVALRDAQPPASRRSDEKPDPNPQSLSLFGATYKVAPKAGGVSYTMNTHDEAGILKSIREGKENADFLVATIHAHEPGNWSETPPDFLPVLAHAAIDAGADAFVTHGPHQLRGIEIYKGKPIFYSLGNFFFEADQQEPVAADMYEQLGLDPRTTTDVELNEHFRDRSFKDAIWYQSVVAVSEFRGNALARIRLYPIELGGAGRDADRGIPRPAPADVAATILAHLQALSAPYGTQIAIDHGVGIIDLTSASTGDGRR